jgi:RNase P/RNase MRP subunit p30
VSFPVNSRHSRFRRSLARLFGEKSLEVDIAQLVEPKELPRHVVFSRLRDQVSIAKTNHVSIVLSSGADNPLMLRGPRDIAAIGMQLGLRDVEALESVSEIPFEIVERNRAKLSPNHVTIGVKLTKVKKPVG